jgi:hypothetical protein
MKQIRMAKEYKSTLFTNSRSSTLKKVKACSEPNNSTQPCPFNNITHSITKILKTPKKNQIKKVNTII